MVFYKGALSYESLQNMTISQINNYIPYAKKMNNELKAAAK